mmetsp:Transcript_19804/g.39270  ORF Transcript_19804/g.39270 Transcript_19804/m.39270 type:complete len:181 (+) Transcript_19804:90-632(+)
MAASLTTRIPTLVVFDLDACVWFPEMYQLWGGGAPFEYVAEDNSCTDARGTSVRLLGAIPEVFEEVRERGGKIAIASRTDEPSWARELLTKFTTVNGNTLESLVEGNLTEMYKGSKTKHFESIRRKSGVPFEDMIFFDDDPANIRDVGSLGVVSILTPDGVTREAWDRGMEAFALSVSKL